MLIRSFLLLMILVELYGGTAAGRNQSVSRESRRHRNILEQRSTILENLKFELHQVSDWCQNNGLKKAAADVTQLSLDLTTDSPRTRPARMITPPPDAAIPEAERQWRAQTRQLREDRARELYTLARKALRADLPSIAYGLIQDVLRLNPDHTNARAIIGQQRFNDPLRRNDNMYAGEWVSPYEAGKRGGANTSCSG